MATTSTYTVERSVTVDAPPPLVYEQVADFHAWTEWSPWEGLDPHMSRTYTGAESGTGAAYAWSGNKKAGSGRMRILEAVKPSTVRVDLLFEKPFKSHSETVFTVVPQGAGSRVTWTMTGASTPMIRVMSLLKSMDAMVGPDFEKGLARLKLTVEAIASR
jgi:uncharacterized protein YndB with AHSA1/START domain